MSAELFVYRDDAAPRRSLTELCRDLAATGVRCRIEEYPEGPWLVLESSDTDMSLSADPDGTVSSAMVQFNDSPADLDLLLAAFERLGWVVATEDE
jgi:hypothetical protein